MNLEITFILIVALVNTISFGINKFVLKRNFNTLFCGIIGYSAKKNSNPDKLALLMLHNSLKRGEDNTGIYTLETGTVKTKKNATDFLSDYSLPKTHLFIGHVRKQSVGSKEEKNAHPFEFDNIVLVHNGTLKNHWTMLRDSGYDFKDYDTDTQVLAKLLDDDSKKEQKVFSTLSEYEGAAALLFTDKRQSEILYAYRNSERPLFHGFNDGCLYISSLKESLQIISCTDIDEFPPYYLHTIKGGKVTSSVYYKEKIAATTSFYNRDYGTNITNVKYKDVDSNIDQFVKTIKSTEKITTDMLVDRWVTAAIDINNSYGDINNKVKVTKGKWYQICDNSTSNDYDLQFVDDAGNTVWHNKYMFNTDNIAYPNGFAEAVINIFDDTLKTTDVVITKGTIISIAPNAIIDKDNKLSCVYNDEIYDIDINCIRPTLDSEVEKFLAQNVKELNKALKGGNQKTINFNDVKPPISGSTINDFIDYSDMEPKAPTALPALPLPQLKIIKGGDSEPVVDAEAEITDNIETIIESSDEEKLIHYILDVIDDAVDDVLDLTESTNFNELKLKVNELKEIVNESYNIEMVKSLLNEGDQD